MGLAEDLALYAEDQECDVLAYTGRISRIGYDDLCKAIPTHRRKNCLLVLATLGGDPNAGYRIARALSHHYPEPGQIRILVPHYCKSAGTLICIGANELIISDRGELGPLDIQVQKPDEMLQLASGLDIIRGLAYLRDESLTTFRGYLIDINDGGGLSTSIASEIASKLTIGMYNPIFAQIDPLRLGEMQAALTVAVEYGTRLNDRTHNLKQNALQKLSMQYPSHSFVIDRKEVRQLFERVRAPSSDVELQLCEKVGMVFERGYDRITVANLTEIFGSAASNQGPVEGEENVQHELGAESPAEQADEGGQHSGRAIEHSNPSDSRSSEGE